MSDLASWLDNLGLGKYQAVFADNEVDFEILPKLTEQDLKELAIPLGPRKKLLAAIAILRGDGANIAAPKSLPAAAQAERRQLTVMFVDLVDSTALSERYDPEELGQIIRGFQDCCAGVITRYEGFIAHYMGDGILIYFGYPRAHEDDVERALRAGLEVIAAVNKLKPQPQLILQSRIGVATGLVVIGETLSGTGSEAESVVGETPNLAARLQGLAQPDSMVIAASSRRLAGDVFDYTDLGHHQLKGFAQPVQAWQVERLRTLESRFAAYAGTLTPLVGRTEQLELLIDRWQQVCQSKGQTVLVVGEAGIGKSRITQALRQHLTDQEHLYLTYQCSPYHTNSALYPIISHLERAADLQAEDPPAHKVAKLAALLGQTSEPDENLALMASLLSIPLKAKSNVVQMDAQQRKGRILAALLSQLEKLAEQKPVCCIFEDAHWIDPSSLALLNQIVERCRQRRLMLLVTARPEFSAPWAEQAQCTRIGLTRIDQPDSAALIHELTGSRTLPHELCEQIFAKADGIPLFVEELTRAVLESGVLEEGAGCYTLSAPLPTLSVPATLHDSLMARLDQLGPGKDIAQLGAVIGREFSFSLLAALAPLSESELTDVLARLVEAGLIFRYGAGTAATYSFKHALLQDAAYASLLLSRRRELHTRIADALQQYQPERVEIQPELIAHHCSEAGLTVKAVYFWKLAGERATERAAYAEAIAHFSRGIDLVEAIENEPERLAATTKLNLGLAASMRMADRLDEALRALEQAEAAAQSAASAIDLAEIYYLRGNLYFPLGRVEECLAQHERSRTYAQEAGVAQLEARALGGLGDAYFLSGRMKTAAQYFEQCLALSRKHGDERMAAPYRVMLAGTLQYQNQFKAALNQAMRSAEYAAQAGHLRAEMMACSQIGQISLQLARLKQARDALEKALEYARRLGARRFEAIFLALLSEFPGLQGRKDEACAMLEQAYVISRETSIRFVGPVILGGLARQSADPSVRERVLREGEDLLRKGCPAHCHFYFYRDAIEASMATGDWDRMEYYATALEVYTRLEPLPWSDFVISRGRALAAHGRNGSRPEIQQQLRWLYNEAMRVGLVTAGQALERALK